MATTTVFPPQHTAELMLKDILSKHGISPIILKHWRITIEEDHLRWRYNIHLTWRNYRISESISREASIVVSEKNHMTMIIANCIASRLWMFNKAEDEEHMEALVLLSMRPTNEQHLKQL